MNNDTVPPFLPNHELIAAYEAGFRDECRRVISLNLITCMPKMKKWIIEYSVIYHNPLGQEAHETIIGKIYSDPEKGKASYGLLEHLWQHGMNGDSPYAVVRPIAYLPSFHLMLMSKAPGMTVQEWIFETDRVHHAAFHTAIFLSCLHKVPILPTPLLIRNRAEDDLSRFMQELINSAPEQETAIQSFAARMRKFPPPPCVGEPAMLHGDFHIKNVFWDNSSVTAIDFDHHFTGDPAWDVAYHACQIQLSAFFRKGDFHYFRFGVKTFIQTYLTEVPEDEHEDFLKRILYYRARSLFESLHYEICVCKTKKNEIIEPFLQECELSLQGKGFQ